MSDEAELYPVAMFIGIAREPHFCAECSEYIQLAERHWIKKYDTEVGPVYTHLHINCSSVDRNITAQEVVL